MVDDVLKKSNNMEEGLHCLHSKKEHQKTGRMPHLENESQKTSTDFAKNEWEKTILEKNALSTTWKPA